MECVNYKSNTKYNIYHAFILSNYQHTFIIQFLQNEIPFVIFKMFLSVHLSTKNVLFLFDYCNTCMSFDLQLIIKCIFKFFLQ